ncbi:hypothetical protein Avbf_01348 [Armadillidium vulgare]|nr:hypothetical protein Avbf_01348 [Armadillidium vulgare]
MGCRIESVKAARYQLNCVCDALSSLRENITGCDLISECESLENEITSYEFVVSLVVWYDILDKIHAISKVWQSEHIALRCGLSSLLKRIFKRSFKMPRKSSAVWRFFSKEDVNRATCNLCGKSCSTSGNTTNIANHLKSKHLDAFESLTSGILEDSTNVESAKWDGTEHVIESEITSEKKKPAINNIIGRARIEEIDEQGANKGTSGDNPHVITVSYEKQSSNVDVPYLNFSD